MGSRGMGGWSRLAGNHALRPSSSVADLLGMLARRRASRFGRRLRWLALRRSRSLGGHSLRLFDLSYSPGRLGNFPCRCPFLPLPCAASVNQSATSRPRERTDFGRLFSIRVLRPLHQSVAPPVGSPNPNTCSLTGGPRFCSVPFDRRGLVHAAPQQVGIGLSMPSSRGWHRAGRLPVITGRLVVVGSSETPDAATAACIAITSSQADRNSSTLPLSSAASHCRQPHCLGGRSYDAANRSWPRSCRTVRSGIPTA